MVLVSFADRDEVRHWEGVRLEPLGWDHIGLDFIAAGTQDPNISGVCLATLGVG